ncbi:poly [ADP-ribose] polymerase tankyrase-1-like [Paramacrobiotus metropolitanus]|uniref:poly [ADP-ribose] polymerase tankyrase-1-like n=1 Tax=Paramacrobiotus metropolitanus TaxID=2943436 RepID=UPI0024457268|nr:poly [ADP-ribose] polymerase tankyrase-1-like [Paramacrobiotus metropolitanus]XP_055349065.1 poly [ADP-ribose] polymerase tankyrase-1-like [Paramacrobiotus metropolitanus]XP_055349066.1 poly [ADP-ribose] polymerase tankyrase-1-like [Paramacrobiotus metropolitanus]
MCSNHHHRSRPPSPRHRPPPACDTPAAAQRSRAANAPWSSFSGHCIPEKMTHLEKILARGMRSSSSSATAGHAHPANNTSTVASHKSSSAVPSTARHPPRRAQAADQLPASPSRAGNYSRHVPAHAPAHGYDHVHSQHVNAVTGQSEAGTGAGAELEMELDDDFGFPECFVSRLPDRRSPLYQPPHSVLDACLLCDEEGLCDILKKGVTRAALNRRDTKTGRTGLAYACAQGYLGILDILVGMVPILDVNAADNEGNTPLHLAAEAGHADVLSNLLAFFRDVQIDARNHSGLTPLMKAAIQGRTNCAKILLFAGACPALRDGGRCLCASEWARLCGRHTAAEIIDRFPHTSCLLHPVAPPGHGHPHNQSAGLYGERSARGGPNQAAYSAKAGSRTPQSARRTPTSNGSQPARDGDSGAGSPVSASLMVRRTQRAASEPNLQSRKSLQLELLQPAPNSGKPNWIRRKLAKAFGQATGRRDEQETFKERRSASLHPAVLSEQLKYASSPSLQGLAHNAPFACYSTGQRAHGSSDNLRSKAAMVVPKVKVYHSDSECDTAPPEVPEKKHKLNFKKVMMFRKRSASSSKLKKI